MKKILVTFLIFAGFIATAQVKIGDNPTAPMDDSVLLEMESTNKGFLMTRVALTSATDAVTVPTPVTSLLVYNTATAGTNPDNVTPGFYYWNGTRWNSIGAGSGSTVAVTAVSPVVSASGKVWMDRNLGASRRAQSVTDHLAYGQLYQWGRGNDGHADINWTSATAGTPVNGTTATLSTTDYPADNLFIVQPASPYDWRATQNDNLWQGVNGINNPCPAGYRLPTNAELTTEVTTYSITNSADAFASPLRFTVPGIRDRADGSLYNVGSFGDYWSSSVSGTYASIRKFNVGSTTIINTTRAYGFTVRCLKE